MNNVKRVGILLIIALTVVVLGASFEGSDILERSIIIGIGVDESQDGVMLTAEVVSPGNGGEEVGTFSKVVSASGISCGDALRKLAELTGKEASLGQAVLLVFGETYFSTQNISDTVDFFISSDGFKENASVCCCKGSAKDLLANNLALDQSVSIALAQSLLKQANSVAMSTTYLLEYARSQRELYRTGFLNYVEYTPSDNTDDTGGGAQGFFTIDKIAVFRACEFVCLLDEYQTRGFALLDDQVKGETFAVIQNGTEKTVVVNSKTIQTDLYSGNVWLQVTLYAKYARTESDETGGIFASKNKRQFDNEVVQNVISQAQTCIDAFLQAQNEYDFDLIGLHEAFRRKFGNCTQSTTLSVADIPVSVTLSVSEK